MICTQGGEEVGDEAREDPLDLRGEVLRLLRQDPQVRVEIAASLIREATGGPEDAKGIKKGGATVLKAYEMLCSIIAESGQGESVEPDFSRLSDAELRAMLREE